MKSIIFFAVFCLLATHIHFEAKTLNNLVLSSSYQIAKIHNNQFYVDNEANFKAPLIAAKLPKRGLGPTGKPVSVVEIPSETDYYDGSKKLKITVVNCNQWASKKEACLHQGQCGWCGSSNTCISGNKGGPTAPCLRGTFLYTSPSADFNPFEDPKLTAHRVNMGGAQLTTFK